MHTSPPLAFHGIDFSGARDAGNKIWLASCRIENNKLHLHECQPASALPNSGALRELALAALRAWVITQPNSIIGCDFPFSLAQSKLGYADWHSFITNFAADYSAELTFQQAHGGVGNEVRRQTDAEAKTPFAAGNLRLFRQTYYGLRDFLAPLYLNNLIQVLPMQRYERRRPTLIEVCPASLLKRINLYILYKGITPTHRAARGRILDQLCTAHQCVVPEAMRALLIEEANGDALDSVIAAVMAARAWQAGELLRPVTPIELCEGHVYV
jgi:Protein of unknown function (DUF429)